MSAGLIGALIGLALALAYFAFARALAKRVELEETRKALRISALVEIVLLPVLGYAAGAFVFGD